MSNFYLYPLLLSQGYSPIQIQQILHSFGYFPNYQCHALQNSLMPFQDDHLLMRPSSSMNLIIQQDNKSVSQFNSLSQNSDHQIIQIKASQKENPIKQQQLGKQQQPFQEQSEEKTPLNDKKQPKNKKKKKIKKMTLKQKREKQMKRNQTQNSKRNIIPNEIHQMLSILFKKKKSSGLVEKLISKFSFGSSKNSFSTKRFYLYQTLLKEKINHYANQQSLKVLVEPLEPAFKIYSSEQQNLYCKIGLILIKHFLNNEASLIILNSQRIKSENKLDHLKTKRYLSYVLKQLTCISAQKGQISF